MKVLVTGTDGYIGVMLGPVLQERGHQVTGLDTGYYRDGWLYDGAKPLAHTIRKDIRHITEKDLEGFDAVAHLAELSNDPLGQLNPDITYKINHQGSVELARKAKAAGVRRFVYTSSCSVYGLGSDEYRTELSETAPQTAYAKCKVMVERDVALLAAPGFSPTYLRNATAYGPSPRMRFDIVVNNLSALAWTTREIKMTSDGTPWRPLVHLLDICQAVACCLEAPKEAVHNEIFNVGNTEDNYRVREIAEIVAQTFPGCRLSFGKVDPDNRSYRVSFEKIKDRLPGFKTKYRAGDGAAQLKEVFEKIAFNDDTFKFRAFTRLKQLEHLIGTGKLDNDFFWK
ncbi:MAG TPA: SDR family oxidoreductase [Fibrobacteria bacterium]|nr:SDR family oxidoreductase [Fibrobacteria bacterium]